MSQSRAIEGFAGNAETRLGVQKVCVTALAFALQGPFGRLIIMKRQSGTKLLSKVPKVHSMIPYGNPWILVLGSQIYKQSVANLIWPARHGVGGVKGKSEWYTTDSLQGKIHRWILSNHGSQLQDLLTAAKYDVGLIFSFLMA